MKAHSYLTSLLPSFGKDQVIEDIRLTRGELQDVTIPAYEAAAGLLKDGNIRSKALEGDLALFKRTVKASTGGFTQTVLKALKTSLENLEHAEELITKTYSDEVAGGGVTYMKANLLQLVEVVAFVSKFARKYLVYIYVHETAEYEDSGTDLAESITPAEGEWLRANFLSFCTAVNIVSTAPSSLRKSLADIPDVVVTPDNAHTMGATLGENKIDPLQMRLIPVWLNPIYHIGMFVAEWQASRYKSAQEELKLIQLRKLNLERLADGKPDARIQKEITYMESRIQGLNYKIAKMEKNNG